MQLHPGRLPPSDPIAFAFEHPFALCQLHCKLKTWSDVFSTLGCLQHLYLRNMEIRPTILEVGCSLDHSTPKEIFAFLSHVQVQSAFQFASSFSFVLDAPCGDLVITGTLPSGRLAQCRRQARSLLVAL